MRGDSFMKFLIVGAGAVGGYFGARLAEKGEDVTFLVREKRKKQLDASGLTIESTQGDLTFKPKTITIQEAKEFDVILLATKSYHFKKAAEDIKAFVGSSTVIIPMLNGIKHLDDLFYSFSKQTVMGGLCFIESTLSNEGEILHTSPMHQFVFGEWNGEKSERARAIEKAFKGTNADVRLSENILTEMWHKYLFISTLSGVTTLFREPVGPIREAGIEYIKRLLHEISEIMRAENAPIEDGIEEKQLTKINEMGYEMKSSMQRDMEKGYSIEADQLQGYLLELAKKHNLHTPFLESIYTNLKIYENQMTKSR